MTTALYVRHADVFNPEEVMYGRLPRFRISDYGRFHAERLAAYLAEEPISAVYTSPMLRARQTARILARRHPGVPIRANRALAEIRTSWQGTANRDLPHDKTVYEMRRLDSDESIADILKRMKTFLDYLALEHHGETVVCVSHGDPIKILTLGLAGVELDVAAVRKPDPARCSVTRVRYAAPGVRPEVTYTDVLGRGSFRTVTTLDTLPPGALQKASLGGHTFLLARTAAGQVYALGNRCPHMRAHLHEGALEEDLLTCPLHGAQFRVSTGELVRPPQCGINWTANYGSAGQELTAIEAGPLATYEVRVEGNEVQVRSR